MPNYKNRKKCLNPYCLSVKTAADYVRLFDCDTFESNSNCKKFEI